MSEIEKLYENANVEKEWKPLPYGDIEEYYPEFTAEKQIELIKWLIANGRHYFTVSIEPKEFTEYLARYVNEVWLVLSDTEKAEIKRILE